MATPSDGTNAQAVLRAITYRLSSTSPRQLPQVAAQLAGQIWACKDLISSPLGSTKQGNEGSIIVNRFRTYLSTLLQDRTIEGRWAAVVLVKATIEAGGVEALSKSNAWVRSLLGMLKKPDPSTTRILANSYAGLHTHMGLYEPDPGDNNARFASLHRHVLE